MARNHPQENLQTKIFWGQLSITCSNVTHVAQSASSSCSRPLPATENEVRDVRSNWLEVIPTLYNKAVNPDRQLQSANARHKS